MTAMSTRRTTLKAAITPIPTFDPGERPVLLGVVILDWLAGVPMRWLAGVGGGTAEDLAAELAGVSEGTVEEIAAGLYATAVNGPAAAVFSDSRRRLIMSVSVDCHRTWITSAQTVLLPAGMSFRVTVSRAGEKGRGPGDSVDVEKTFSRSVPMRLMQAKSTIGWLVVEKTK